MVDFEEGIEAVLSVLLLVLAGTMAVVAFLAQRDYRDARFLSVGVALILLVIVGITSLISIFDPNAEPAFDIGLVPLVLLVAVAILLNLPFLLRFPRVRARGHG